MLRPKYLMMIAVIAIVGLVVAGVCIQGSSGRDKIAPAFNDAQIQGDWKIDLIVHGTDGQSYSLSDWNLLTVFKNNVQISKITYTLKIRGTGTWDWYTVNIVAPKLSAKAQASLLGGSTWVNIPSSYINVTPVAIAGTFLSGPDWHSIYSYDYDVSALNSAYFTDTPTGESYRWVFTITKGSGVAQYRGEDSPLFSDWYDITMPPSISEAGFIVYNNQVSCDLTQAITWS